MARHSGRGLWKQDTWESVVYLTAEEQAVEDALVAEIVAALDQDSETVAEVEAFLNEQR